MYAREYYENLREQVLELDRREQSLVALKESCGPTGRASGTGDAIRSSGAHTPVVDRLIDAEIALERDRRSLAPELTRATDVLYGRDSCGGVASMVGTAAADSVCGYYLMGMSWADVADELVRPDSKDGAQWCRVQARRAFACIDSVGMARLIDGTL